MGKLSQDSINKDKREKKGVLSYPHSTFYYSIEWLNGMYLNIWKDRNIDICYSDSIK